MRAALIALLVGFGSVAVAQNQTYTYQEYQPISIHHNPGDVVQVLSIDGGFPIFLDAEYFGMYSDDPGKNDFTVWCAPVGNYVMNASGKLAIVHVTKDGKQPKPPEPDDPKDDEPPADPPSTETVVLKVQGLTKGLPLNRELAAVFEKHARIFDRADGNSHELYDAMWQEARAVIASSTDYVHLQTYVNNYVAAHWPISNPDSAAFFRKVVEGLR